jgi:hypothetical protein
MNEYDDPDDDHEARELEHQRRMGRISDWILIASVVLFMVLCAAASAYYLIKIFVG